MKDFVSNILERHFLTERYESMSKDKNKNNNEEEPTGKMKNKEFEKELEKLQIELVKLQRWVVHEGARVIIVFEGRDAAGKGGTIKRIVDRVSPRVFRVVALPKPTEREKTEMYIQRYIAHFPAAGEVIIFDRSWYNRAGVEHVMGFCTQQQYEEFLLATPLFEQWMIRQGIILIKYWLEVSEEEQDRRFKSRIKDGRKIWKLSPMDVESHQRWYDYSRARDAMFEATDMEASPWYVINSNDKKRARLNCISHLLSLIPYKDLPVEEVKLGKRESPDGYKEPERTYHMVPEEY
jgi:polyphosphate kinase 2